jgi:GntR family transcriptional regulator
MCCAAWTRRPGRTALHLVRVRSVEGTPCLLENIWLPLPAFEPLLHSDSREWGDLLYPLYALRCGVRVHRAVDEIGFGQLSVAQARRLLLPAGHPCAGRQPQRIRHRRHLRRSANHAWRCPRFPLQRHAGLKGV